MLPLARFWTWLGHAFIPLAGAWVYFVRNGPDKGVLISRGYFGLALALLAGTALALVLARYILLAKARHATIIIPPNMTFEDLENRNLTISWGTLVVFTACLVTAYAVFASRYGDSRIHRWDSPTPIEDSFWGSRIKAHQISCAERTCFAIGQPVNSKGLVQGVIQYLPFYTDGLIVVLSIMQMASLAYLAIVASRTPTPNPKYDL